MAARAGERRHAVGLGSVEAPTGVSRLTTLSFTLAHSSSADAEPVGISSHKASCTHTAGAERDVNHVYGPTHGDAAHSFLSSLFDHCRYNDRIGTITSLCDVVDSSDPAMKPPCVRNLFCQEVASPWLLRCPTAYDCTSISLPIPHLQSSYNAACDPHRRIVVGRRRARLRSLQCWLTWRTLCRRPSQSCMTAASPMPATPSPSS